ncbi:MAG TPA: PLP-dependent aminotransferase family protein [Peptococcaceae bacterium]|nr:PLP-dependent aminotransferase family protein [Peptococcaceae bacterium]
MKYASWTNDLRQSFLGEILKTASYTETISFAGGLPAQELFPNQELKECFNQVFEEDGPIALQYAEARGYEPLRQWIYDRINTRSKLKTTSEIIITTGSQQGLSLVAQTFLDPGDIVLVESPTYLGALQAFQGYRPRFVMVPCDEEGIIPEELAEILTKCQPKYLYVIPNYQNPTGRQLSLARRLEIIEIARRFNLLILEDNPYGELRFEGEALPDLRDLYENVIYLGSFSKILSPGLRVGFLVADQKTVSYIERAKEGVDLFSNNLTQRAVYKYITSRNFKEHILKLRKVYCERRDTMLQAFKDYLGSDVQVETPKGGLFIWAKILKTKDSLEFLNYAQAEKVIYVPGTFFYPDGRRSNEMRINYSCSSPEVIEEGIKRLGRAVERI